jgi:formylglycine-generating enzyme
MKTEYLRCALGTMTMAIAVGCTSEPPPEQSEGKMRTGHTALKAALAPDNSAILGMETPSAWSTTNSGAVLGRSSTHTEGSYSLSVRPSKSNGFTPIKSAAMTTLGAVSPALAVDIMLPNYQPNPWWHGTAQAYINCPSRGIYSQFLNQVELTGKPLGEWFTIEFVLANGWIAGLLQSGYSDLTITIVLNVQVPTTGTYFIDNLRFLPVAPNGCAGRPNGTLCKGSNACTKNETCVAGTCAGTGTSPSCAGVAANCGPSGNESCCTALLVPGGTFNRSNDPGFPATVSDFCLDKYEVTVGRFRAFMGAGKGTQASPPAAGDAAHSLISGSGWDPAWNASLASDTTTLRSLVNCPPIYRTWTDDPGANESKPMNCITWYEAFAFCAWDGGRLPTEAEWNYAAAGGNEQREYPWSSPPSSTNIDDSYAVYCGGSCSSAQNVGTKSPKGDGKWGHSDLAGNVWEWTLDWYGTYPLPCTNCASLGAASYRVIRGGSWDDVPSDVGSAGRGFLHAPGDRGFGLRCARSSP